MIGFDDLWQGWLRAALTSSILLAVGSIAVALTREPVRRSRLVLITLGGALFAPVLGLLPGLPHWSAPVLSGGVPGRDPAAIEANQAMIGAKRAPTDPTDPPAAPPRTKPELAELRDVPAPATYWPAMDLRRLIMAAHLLGATGWLGWWGVGLIVLRRVARAGRPADQAIRERFAAIAGPAGARVRLLASDRIAAPFTFTWRRPTILLPANRIKQGSADELRFALAHEWAHVARGDYRSWTFASLAGLWLGINPLYWLLRRELRLGQDFLADDHAAATESPADCAAYLVRLARTRRGRPAFPLPALGIAGRRSHLFRRVAMLLADRPPHAIRCRSGWTALVTLVALGAVIAAGSFRFAAARQDDPGPRSGRAVGSPPTVEAQTPSVSIVPGPTSPAAPTAPSNPTQVGRDWTGRVVDRASGLPIADAEVRVEIRRSPDPVTDASRLRTIRTTTAGDGSYKFDLTPEERGDQSGGIEVHVDHPGHVPYTGLDGMWAITRELAEGKRPGFERVEIEPSDPIAGRVLNPDGGPASEVLVRASRPSPTPGGDPMISFGTNPYETRTEATGRFALALPAGGEVVVWILPEDLEPAMRRVDNARRGDLGTFRLEHGLVISGQVVDEAGRPVGGVYVTAARNEAERRGADRLPVGMSDLMVRTTSTLPDGTFRLSPMPPGRVVVYPDAHNGAAAAGKGFFFEQSRPPLPAAYGNQKLTLVAGQAPEPIVIRPVPQVTISAQLIDSRGAMPGGAIFSLYGWIDGRYWSTSVETKADGRFTAAAPKGLSNAILNLGGSGATVLMHRMSHDAPLNSSMAVQLGTLDHDIAGIEIVRFKAPAIRVKAIFPAGKVVRGVEVEVMDVDQRHFDHYMSVVHVEGPDENGWFRTRFLPPDREVEVKVSAPGYATATRKVAGLPEGGDNAMNFWLDPK